MQLNVIEKTDEKIKVEVRGESETFVNLLRKNLWSVGVEQATYIKEHPYLSVPKIIVYSKNPVKALSDAAQLIVDQTQEFKQEFKRALEK